MAFHFTPRKGATILVLLLLSAKLAEAAAITIPIPYVTLQTYSLPLPTGQITFGHEHSENSNEVSKSGYGYTFEDNKKPEAIGGTKSPSSPASWNGNDQPPDWTGQKDAGKMQVPSYPEYPGGQPAPAYGAGMGTAQPERPKTYGEGGSGIIRADQNQGSRPSTVPKNSRKNKWQRLNDIWNGEESNTIGRLDTPEEHYTHPPPPADSKEASEKNASPGAFGRDRSNHRHHATDISRVRRPDPKTRINNHSAGLASSAGTTEYAQAAGSAPANQGASASYGNPSSSWWDRLRATGYSAADAPKGPIGSDGSYRDGWKITSGYTDTRTTTSGKSVTGTFSGTGVSEYNRARKIWDELHGKNKIAAVKLPVDTELSEDEPFVGGPPVETPRTEREPLPARGNLTENGKPTVTATPSMTTVIRPTGTNAIPGRGSLVEPTTAPGIDANAPWTAHLAKRDDSTISFTLYNQQHTTVRTIAHTAYATSSVSAYNYHSTNAPTDGSDFTE